MNTFASVHRLPGPRRKKSVRVLAYLFVFILLCTFALPSVSEAMGNFLIVVLGQNELERRQSFLPAAWRQAAPSQSKRFLGWFRGECRYCRGLRHYRRPLAVRAAPSRLVGHEGQHRAR